MARSDVKEIVTALQASGAFDGCGKADLEDLAEHANRTSVPAHWPLIHAQTPSDAVYVILDGDADVLVGDATVASLHAGAVVGEAGVASHKLRNATVTSTTALDLLHIEAAPFTELVSRRPALEKVLLARTQPAADAAADA